jgi:hypothetical protein
MMNNKLESSYLQKDEAHHHHQQVIEIYVVESLQVPLEIEYLGSLPEF